LAIALFIGRFLVVNSVRIYLTGREYFLPSELGIFAPVKKKIVLVNFHVFLYFTIKLFLISFFPPHDTVPC
jgi:hypothetical protein